MKKTLTLWALAVTMAVPLSSLAQATAEEHHHPHDGTPLAAALTDGEVKKIDLDNGKITIKHGDIRHLDMPGMTMVFSAKDKNLLTPLKPGEKIQFMVVTESGKMVITEIHPAR